MCAREIPRSGRGVDLGTVVTSPLESFGVEWTSSIPALAEQAASPGGHHITGRFQSGGNPSRVGAMMWCKSSALPSTMRAPTAYMNAVAVKKLVVGSRVGQCKVALFARYGSDHGGGTDADRTRSGRRPHVKIKRNGRGPDAGTAVTPWALSMVDSQVVLMHERLVERPQNEISVVYRSSQVVSVLVDMPGRVGAGAGVATGAGSGLIWTP
eukprot:gene24683-biopygen7412